MKNILEGLVTNAGIIKDKAKIEGKAERLARISLATEHIWFENSRKHS